MLYGLAVLAVLGVRFLFNFFSLVAGILLIVFSYWDKLWISKQKAWLQKGFMGLALCGILFFLATEFCIIRTAVSKPLPNADYVLLLGSKVESWGPSTDYKARLDAADAYLKENPNTQVIACGGQGSDEHISEAQAAYDYLSARGIETSRIYKEDQSTNTFENIQNAAGIVKELGKDPKEVNVVIISADYHLMRAKLLAKEAGFTHVSSKPSQGLWILVPHYYMREFFAYWKDVIVH